MDNLHPLFVDIINMHFPGLLETNESGHATDEWESKVSLLEDNNPLKIRYDNGERTDILFNDIKDYNND